MPYYKLKNECSDLTLIKHFNISLIPYFFRFFLGNLIKKLLIYKSMRKDLNISRFSTILLSILFVVKIRPTKHYLRDHSDVDWDLVVLTILSPTKTKSNKRKGKDRFTYYKEFHNFGIKLHVKQDYEGNVWVINAFRDIK